MSTLVIGRGLLGSALYAHLRSPRHTPAVPWLHPRHAGDVLERVVIDHLREQRATGAESWTVAWCAGAAMVGSTAAHMATERALLGRTLRAIGAAASDWPGRFLHASSAGGVFGAGGPDWFDEHSPPCSVSAYGDGKLQQERLVASWAGVTGHQALSVRMSNLYGAGQDMTKPQGFVSHLCRAAAHHQPLTLSVSAETQRDFVHVDDVAGWLARWCEGTDGAAAPGASVRVLASGRPVSLAHLISVVRSVTRVGVGIVMASNPASSLQPRFLRVRSAFGPDVGVTPIEVGVRRLWDQLARS
ncbi:MAG: SDR family oxidoreductase [Actinomycetota bacterium]|nr:SDR family oxidoreductase [Actinomycetota bacterium]